MGSNSTDARPDVHGFFHPDSNTISYLVRDPGSKACAAIDPVRDFDQASGRTGTASVQTLVDTIREIGLELEWILETHVHADHLSGAPCLKDAVGGRIAIGAHVIEVQRMFAEVFNEGSDFVTDGSQFDRLLDDDDSLELGNLRIRALHTPGHTPACMTYVIGDAAFVGDTLFMPDYGTARCDFPGGDARTLYRSIRRVLALPRETRLFMCHDYKAPGRDEFAWETTVAAQRERNVHVHEGIGEDSFVEMREGRDATLSMPRLMLPSVQVNMRAGHFPAPESNGVRYLKLPIDT